MGKKKAVQRDGRLDAQAGGFSKYLNVVEDGDTVDSKHALYQRAVQSPKGDISYLVKFFLTYIGGRAPLHLREDFCGTALICTEWLLADPRRTATGLDLDDDALAWGIRHNLSKVPCEGEGRICLLLGDVLNDAMQAQVYSCRRNTESSASISSEKEDEDKLDASEEGVLLAAEAPHNDASCATSALAEAVQAAPLLSPLSHLGEPIGVTPVSSPSSGAPDMNGFDNGQGEWSSDKRQLAVLRRLQGQPADIICAFNFSTCCLHTRMALLRYFRHVRNAIHTKGGVFAMDLYGGVSSECPLKLKRRFGDFTYTWEQEEFCAVTRMTRISLHFRLEKSKRSIRRAFSYKWRLWTIPEVRECLLEAGFQEVRVWMREMPDIGGWGGIDREDESQVNLEGLEVEADARKKFEETARFLQCDAWNAYVVGIA